MNINISIDDVCPHPNSGVNILNCCFDLISCYPDIKFTLFVPMAYTRLNESTYNLCDYFDFCDKIRNLPKKNFEFGWHGYHHGINGKSHNDEFAYLEYSDANKIISLMFGVAEKAGIKQLFSPIFRPPAFRLSDGAFKALVDNGIDVFALAPLKDYDYSYIDGSVKIFNWNAMPPKYPIVKNEDLNIVYHASTWSNNLLDGEKVVELKRFMQSQDSICFKYMMG